MGGSGWNRRRESEVWSRGCNLYTFSIKGDRELVLLSNSTLFSPANQTPRGLQLAYFSLLQTPVSNVLSILFFTSVFLLHVYVVAIPSFQYPSFRSYGGGSVMSLNTLQLVSCRIFRNNLTGDQRETLYVILSPPPWSLTRPLHNCLACHLTRDCARAEIRRHIGPLPSLLSSPLIFTPFPACTAVLSFHPMRPNSSSHMPNLGLISAGEWGGGRRGLYCISSHGRPISLVSCIHQSPVFFLLWVSTHSLVSMDAQ